MLQFASIQLLLLLLSIDVQSIQAFETDRMISINMITKMNNVDIQDVINPNQVFDNLNYNNYDKNEVNNIYLIEPQQKSLKVFSQKSLLVEHEPIENLQDSSQQNYQKKLQIEDSDQTDFSIKDNQDNKDNKDTKVSNDRDSQQKNAQKMEHQESDLNEKLSNIISKQSQDIEDNNEIEITIQDIKIESIHKQNIPQINNNESKNDDVLIIKTDLEIKATPRIVGVLDKDPIKQNHRDQELNLQNENHEEVIEQCEGEENDTVQSQSENKPQELEKSNDVKNKDQISSEKGNEKDKKLTSNIINNNKKQQNQKKQQQSKVKIDSKKSKQNDQKINSKQSNQNLIGDLIKVQVEQENVDLSIFSNDNSDLIPIIVEDSQNIDTQIEDPQVDITINKVQDVDQNNNEENKIDQINFENDYQDQNNNQIIDSQQKQDIDEQKFEDFQSELDELAKELDQLSLEQNNNSDLNDEKENLEENESNDSLQYITISTNNDPIIFNTLEEDYYLDDLNNQLDLQTQQQDQLNSKIDNVQQNKQEQVQVLIVNNPEQLIIQNIEDSDQTQSLEDQVNQNGIIEQQNIVSTDDNDSNNDNITIDYDNNKDDQQSLQQKEDGLGMDKLQFENLNSKNIKNNDIKIKRNSSIKKEVSVGVDNMISNENIKNQNGFTDDEFLRIASESKAEVIENLEDLQESMQDIQYNNKVQNKKYYQSDQIKNTIKYPENNNKEYSLKINQNRKQIKYEENYQDQIRNTQIKEQYQKSKDDEFNQMINNLINDFDSKTRKESDILEYDRQITQHIIDNIEELKYANRKLKNEYNYNDNEEYCENEEEQQNDQTYQEAQTELKKIQQRREEFQQECNDDQQSNSEVNDYEKDIDKRKKEVIEKIKKEIMMKKERLKNSNKQSTDNLSSYEFERIYLDWATNKEDIVSNILLHTSNSDIELQQSDNVQVQVKKISKQQEMEEELQELYQTFNKDRKSGRNLRGQK